MKFRLLILTTLFILSLQNLIAQNQVKIDSLQIVLNNTKEDTIKIRILLDLSVAHSRIDLLKSLKFAEQALELSKQIDYDLGKARSHLKMGNALIFIGNYEKAQSNFLASLQIAQKNNFINEEFIATTHLGIIQDRIEKFDNALKYYFDALNIYNKSVENKTQINQIQGLYNNIGNIYLSKNKLDIAEEYYLKGLALADQKKDYLNIGTICNNLGKLENQRKNFDEAYIYLTKSLKARETVNDKSGIAKSYFNLGNHFYEKGQIEESESFVKKSLEMGMELKEPLTNQNAAQLLYQIYKKQGKFVEALEYHEKFKALSDSLMNENNIQEMTRLQMQFDYEKSEKEKEAKAQMVKYMYIIIFSALSLIIIIFALLFFLARSRSRHIKAEKEKLEEAMLIKNKELTTNVIYLLKKNELINSISTRLINLKEKLKPENKEPIQKIIYDLQSIADNDVWNDFEIRFQNVHQEFYNTLQTKFPDLSPSEIKLAAFLRLNMTTKEIATITGQSINTLETARYRLRKKLGITNQEVNLVNFLLQI